MITYILRSNDISLGFFYAKVEMKKSGKDLKNDNCDKLLIECRAEIF